jgi:hypothetical protein
MRTNRRTKNRIGELPFERTGRRTHGGRRAGAGRPRKSGAGVSHAPRPVLKARFPVHVTVKLQRGLPRMRLRSAYAALRAAFTAGRSGGRSAAAGAFRLCHFAILNDHLHFLIEADDRTALSRGAQGLLIRVARALNRLWQRRGGVVGDRFHSRILRTPREVRNAIRYVLANGKKHAAEGCEVAVPTAIDYFTSAPWFDGFREVFTVRGIDLSVRPVLPPESWLMTRGWQRHGLLSVFDMPATA